MWKATQDWYSAVTARMVPAEHSCPLDAWTLAHYIRVQNLWSLLGVQNLTLECIIYKTVNHYTAQSLSL